MQPAPQGALHGVDFTDCPYVATQYASTRRGVVLVVDVRDGERSVDVREALWLHSRAKRFIISGEFDRLIVGVIPAKDLRKRLRQKGIGALPDGDKALVLEWFIREALAGRFERGSAAYPRVQLGPIDA